METMEISQFGQRQELFLVIPIVNLLAYWSDVASQREFFESLRKHLQLSSLNRYNDERIDYNVLSFVCFFTSVAFTK